MRSPFSRSTSVLAISGLLITACGAGSSDSAPTSNAVAAASSSTVEPLSESSGQAADTAQPDVTETPAAEPPVTEPAGTETPATEPPDTQTAAGIEPPVTEPAGTEPRVTEPAALGGRALAELLNADADTGANPLPDLVVDDVGRGAKANLRNVFPADRPVLLWMWAPH